MRQKERAVRNTLAPTSLVPNAPHDLDAALDFGGRTFVHPEMQSEATISPAVAAAAMRDGYSNVAIIAPFGCLPGRVIEAYAPWARPAGPVVLENDDQPTAQRHRPPRGVRPERRTLRAATPPVLTTPA
jgi:hypothetical protein